jgi:dolichol-phosphate mannosyltransferase
MQVIIYLFIGGLSAVGNILIFSALLAASFQMTTAVVGAWISAAAINYLLCIAILFRHNARWGTGGEVVFYLLTIAIMVGLDLGITLGLAGWGVTPLWSKILATIFGFVGNFMLHKYLSLSRKRNKMTHNRCTTCEASDLVCIR